MKFILIGEPFPVIRTNEDGEANLAGDGLQHNCNTPRQSTLDLSRTLVPPRGSSSSRNGHVVMNRFISLEFATYLTLIFMVLSHDLGRIPVRHPLIYD
jgi:hypothetical protein